MFNLNDTCELIDAPRIIVIGDIHGDISRFKNILYDSHIIDYNNNWIAIPHNTIVIQLGDQIDSLNRYNDIKEWEKNTDIDIIYYTNYLDCIARAKGGRLISLIGNHELMNVIGDFNYVSKNSLVNNRENLFKPTGIISQILAKRPLIIKIGKYLFSHSILSLEHILLIKRKNKTIDYINLIWKNYLINNKIKQQDKDILDNIIIGKNGLLWNRNINNKIKTKMLFDMMKIDYMFVGHSANDNIELVDNQIWYCDNGISRSFGTNKYEYLEIIDNNIIIKTIIDN